MSTRTRSLSRSISDFQHPNVDPAAVAGIARTLPNNPKLIEAAVLNKIVPYAYDWQTAGVPWYFPTTRTALAQGRGDCEEPRPGARQHPEGEGHPVSA